MDKNNEFYLVIFYFRTFTSVKFIPFSLLPPSCIVVPIRDLGNITQSSAIISFNNNYDEVRGCSLDMSAYRPRSPSMSLNECDKKYHVHIK